MKEIWRDTKRHLGLPISFTNYRLDSGRLFRKSGILVRKEDQLMLYHIRDLEVRVSLWQRIFGVGTVTVVGADATTPRLELENVRNPDNVRDLLYKYSEQDKQRRRMTRTEFIDSDMGDEYN